MELADQKAGRTIFLDWEVGLSMGATLPGAPPVFLTWAVARSCALDPGISLLWIVYPTLFLCPGLPFASCEGLYQSLGPG
jgi:hypothetical protein